MYDHTMRQWGLLNVNMCLRPVSPITCLSYHVSQACLSYDVSQTCLSEIGETLSYLQLMTRDTCLFEALLLDRLILLPRGTMGFLILISYSNDNEKGDI